MDNEKGEVVQPPGVSFEGLEQKHLQAIIRGCERAGLYINVGEGAFGIGLALRIRNYTEEEARTALSTAKRELEEVNSGAAALREALEFVFNDKDRFTQKGYEMTTYALTSTAGRGYIRREVAETLARLGKGYLPAMNKADQAEWDSACAALQGGKT